VDFISVADPKNPLVNLRVFERGVEGETWSCGTGVAAVGWSCRKFFGWNQSIKVITQGGEHQVKFVGDQLWYSGEIRLVFKGELP
jgi:diaminopimelate epimerase